jgi:hypothetical protein
MAATIDIDEARLKALMAATGAATGNDAIRAAVDEYLGRRTAAAILELEGRLKFDLDWRDLEELEAAPKGPDGEPGPR